MNNEYGVFLVDEDNNVMGRYDDTRLRALEWYKQLWAKISIKYRNKYVNIKPIKVKLNSKEDTVIYLKQCSHLKPLN